MIANDQIDSFIKANLDGFYDTVAYVLGSVNLTELLRDENPYLLMRHGDCSTDGLVQSLLNKQVERLESMQVSSLLEGLALRVAATAYGGWKSEHTGIDFKFANQNAWYIVALIPYPNYDEGNEILETEDCFHNAAWSIKKDDLCAEIVPVIGCFYGKESVIERENYLKYCGQNFWELISGDAKLYTRIVEPLRQASAVSNPRVSAEHAYAINRLSAEFYRRFCDESWAIVWEKLIVFTSSKNTEAAPA